MLGDWTLRELVYAALSFGRYYADCPLCDTTVSSRNFLVENLRIAYHLAASHDEDPRELTDEREQEIRSRFTIYGEGPNAASSFRSDTLDDHDSGGDQDSPDADRA